MYIFLQDRDIAQKISFKQSRDRNDAYSQAY